MACITASSARAFCVVLLFVSVASSRVPGALDESSLVPDAPAAGSKVFDVRTYGARGDSRTDNTNAFLKAWNDACKLTGKSRVYIPAGIYKLGAVKFEGPCKGPITFMIDGTLLAPKNPDHIYQSTAWIIFKSVENLAVTGAGTLDGQGAYSWPLNDCRNNPSCRAFPLNIGFSSVNNSLVSQIKSVNSKMGHFNFFQCQNINITGVSIIAPDESPNTDGIKIGFSDNIKITNTHIGTGDDCVALLSGNTNIEISNVHCGPGHGISVGSLGKYVNEKNVVGLTVRNCTFKGTDNGVRIKTWESPAAHIVVSKFVYEDLLMIDVKNPIIIDQQYCPFTSCKQKTSADSGRQVQIEDVKFSNIRGTSRSKVAVNLQCNKRSPCKGIELRDIDLVGQEGPADATCANVEGSSSGKQVPPVSCLR